jgi:hypothetical protein
MVRWVLGCRWIWPRRQSSRDRWSVCDFIPVMEDYPGTGHIRFGGQATTRAKDGLAERLRDGRSGRAPNGPASKSHNW